MADRELLLKFRGDLTSLKKNAKDILRMMQGLGDQVKSIRDKSATESKSVHDKTISQLKQQADQQIQNHRIAQAQIASQAAAAKAEAVAKLQAIQLEQAQLRLQQQQISIKRQLIALEKVHNAEKHGEGGHGEGGHGPELSMHLRGLAGNLTRDLLGGSGSVMSALVGGAAGGGMFLVLEKLSEKVGEFLGVLKELPIKAGEISEHLEQMSARAGVTAADMQKLSLAGAAVGMSQESLARILMRMNLQLTRTSGGVSRAEKELARFGVSIRENGNLVPTTELVKKVADLFQKDLPDGMTKSRLASDIFGVRIGSQMIPLLNQGGEAVQELYDRAEKYSILINEDLLEAQRKFNVETKALNMQWQQLEVTLGAGILPKLAKFLEYLNAGVEAMGKLMGTQDPKQFNEAINSVLGSAQIKAAMAKGAGDYDFKTYQLSKSGIGKLDQNVGEAALKNMPQLNKSISNVNAYGGVGGVGGSSWMQLLNDIKAQGKDITPVIEAFKKQFPEAIEETNKAASGLDKRLQDNNKSISKLAMTTLKYQEALAQLNEKTEEAKLQTKAADLKEKYDQGLIAQNEYFEKSKLIDKEVFDSKVKYIIKWTSLEKQKATEAANAQRAGLIGEVENPAEFAEKESLLNQETAEKMLIIDVQAKEKKLAAENEFNKKKGALVIESIKSEQQAKHAQFQDDAKSQQEHIAATKEALEFSLKQNLVSVTEYTQQRIILIKAEVAASKTAAEEEYANAIKTPQAKAQMDAKVREADAKGERELTTLYRSEIETRISYTNRLYQSKLGLAQNKLTAANLSPAGLGGGAARSAQQEIIDVTKSHLNDLYMVSAELYTTGQQGTDEWYKTLDAIQKARIEVKKMKEELMKAQSNTMGLGGLASQLGSTLQNTRGNFGTLGQVGGLLTTLGEANAKRSSIFNTDTTGSSGVLSAGGGIFGNLKDAITNLVHGDGSFADLSKALSGTIAALGGFLSMLGHSQGKSGDILSGALGGGAMGKDIMSTLGGMGGPIGSMIKSLGPAAGPIGMAAGAAFGGILSGIIGHKNNQTEKFITDIKKQIVVLQTAMNDGSIGIADGIRQLESMRQTVLAQAGHSKKKQKAQLNQEAQAIQDQIFQLQQQQEAMFVELGNQLKVLNAPNQFQSLLGQLNDIFTQYKKFAGAARDAKDLAMANQFLSDSLRNFGETEATALNQAEENAIQDAIKLNDLLMQRQQIITDEAQQEYDIMTQGVLVNQRTQAMTKMNQIQLARNQTNLELEKINQEIDVTNHRVDAERQIFNLATTRIGLEFQLTLIQNRLADKDILRIQALQQIVSVLQSGQSFNTLDSLLAALGLASTLPTNPGGYSLGGNGLIDMQDTLNNLRNQRARDGYGNMAGYLFS